MTTKRIIRLDNTPITYYVGGTTIMVKDRQEAHIFDNKEKIDWSIYFWKECGLRITVEEVDSE